MPKTLHRPVVRGAPNAPIPLLSKLKAKNLYLQANATHAEISKACGISLSSTAQLISREGWPALRRRMALKVEQAATARTEQVMTEATQAIADSAEEVALSGLNRARTAVASTGKFAARDFQSWTGGARNLVQIARQCRGLDGNGTSGAEQPQINLNVFVSKFGPAAAEARPVECVVQPVPALPA